MHISVLKKEIIDLIDPQPNENFIDATFGEGGHSLEILKKNIPNGKVLGIEADSELYLKTKSNLEGITNRLVFINDSYTNLEKIVQRCGFNRVNGIIFDLGMSSWHINESSRGFSFQKQEPLDMRYNGYNQPLWAEEIVNRWPRSEIERILRDYGEERFWRRITENIAEERKIKPIKDTFHLTEVIAKSVPGWYKGKRIHFATKTFQALRIAVNSELENLKIVLPQALKILEPNGRLAVISFHSLEDRIVKIFFKENKNRGLLKILTKKPISPSSEEIAENPRSRSAKLRVSVKI